MNYTIPPINMSIIQNQALTSPLYGRNDVQIINGYCSLFQNVALWWIITALLFLLLEQTVTKRLSNHHPGIARWMSITAFALHAGFLLFILTIIIKGGT